MSIEELRNKKIVVGKRETERAIKKNMAKKVFWLVMWMKKCKRINRYFERKRNTLGIVPLAKDLGLACGIEIEALCSYC